MGAAGKGHTGDATVPKGPRVTYQVQVQSGNIEILRCNMDVLAGRILSRMPNLGGVWDLTASQLSNFGV